MNYPATLVLLIANVVIYFLCFKDREYYFRHFAEWPYSILHEKKYYQIVTSAFLHADLFHLLFNMITLFSFGSYLEKYFILTKGLLPGSLYFVAIYFSSMLLGSIFTVIPHFKNPGYVAVGSSGAISGILFSFIMFFPKTPINIIFIPIPVPAYLFAIFYIAISIYGVKRSLGNIGHEAHLGGALAGIIMTILIFPDVIGKFLGQF